MARSTRPSAGAGSASRSARTGTAARRARRGKPAPRTSGRSTTTSRRPVRSTGSRRRNPNRWRFYVLVALLALILLTMVWFTVGREALASYLDEREESASEHDGPADEAAADDESSPGDQAAGSSGGTDRAPNDDPAAPGPVDDAAAEPDEYALANPVECRSEALTVGLDAGGRTHAAGESVSIQVTVTNSGPVPCLVDLGHESMRVEVTSGDDAIWNSTDCPSGNAARALLLDIDTDAQHTVRWNGQRCGSGSAAAEGTYRVSVAVPATGGPVQDREVLELT